MRKQERAEIARCWAEHERKSLAPSSKLFVAGVCEKMETEFLEKHGIKP